MLWSKRQWASQLRESDRRDFRCIGSSSSVLVCRRIRCVEYCSGLDNSSINRNIIYTITKDSKYLAEFCSKTYIITALNVFVQQPNPLTFESTFSCSTISNVKLIRSSFRRRKSRHRDWSCRWPHFVHLCHTSHHFQDSKGQDGKPRRSKSPSTLRFQCLSISSVPCRAGAAFFYDDKVI